MSKYKNKYRTDSHRLRGWDYSANGIYFITLVTQHRICNLGEIVNQQMQLSDFGKIVDAEWKKSFEIRNELNSKIDDYIDENNMDIPKYNRNNHFFQPNFYDHIIRNKTEFLRIKNYIINNPQNWETDTLKG